MNLLRTPRAKLLAATALLVLLSLCAPLGSGGAVSLSRWLLGGVALVGLGLWLKRSRAAGPGARLPPLRVVARAGLSPRSGLALVRAQGLTFLVAHGDGFAEIQPLPRRSKRASRKAGSRTRRPVLVKEVLQ